MDSVLSEFCLSALSNQKQSDHILNWTVSNKEIIMKLFWLLLRREQVFLYGVFKRDFFLPPTASWLHLHLAVRRTRAVTELLFMLQVRSCNLRIIKLHLRVPLKWGTIYVHVTPCVCVYSQMRSPKHKSSSGNSRFLQFLTWLLRVFVNFYGHNEIVKYVKLWFYMTLIVRKGISEESVKKLAIDV